jgi:hypothetical protein
MSCAAVMGVVPVLAGARGLGSGRTTSAKTTGVKTVAVVRPANAYRVTGRAGAPVSVRFSYGPGAIRASVKITADSSTMDPAEVRNARWLASEVPFHFTGGKPGGRPGSRPRVYARTRGNPNCGVARFVTLVEFLLACAKCSNSHKPLSLPCADLTLPPSSQNASAKSTFSASIQAPSMAKIGSQLGGGGAATLEKVGMNTSQQLSSVAAPKLADGGGNGGMGGGIKNGGGGGDGDEGDDDDYYEEGDEEVRDATTVNTRFFLVILVPPVFFQIVFFSPAQMDHSLTPSLTSPLQDGDANFLTTRQPLGEMYERDAINAVMQEWFKSLTTLPAAIRMAIEMGIVSSSQLVRFMSVDVRPSMVRLVSRSTPTAVSRAFIGRLMADPAFLWKLGFEQAVTIGGGLMYEAAHRGDRLRSEWDLAAANILQLSVANAMTVWCLTPARSFGAAHKYGWQRVMESVPNNAFDRCGPLRQYTLGTRAASFGVKALELSALGAATGGVFHGLTKGLIGLHRRNDADFEPSVPVPDLKTSMLGMGAYLGLSCNLRYQLIGGADRWMTERLTTLASALTATGLGRLANNHFGDQTRLFALGLPIHATAVRSSPTAAVKKSKTKTVTKKVKKKKSKKTSQTAMA